MINVRIKLFPPRTRGGEPRPATTKVWLLPPKDVRAGARWLEPGEVVALEDGHAKALLHDLPWELEQTSEPANRPLYFEADDPAAISQYSTQTPGRAEQAKTAMQQWLEEASEPVNEQAMEVINDLDRREEVIRRREIELGLREPDPGSALMMDDIDKELKDYVPENNAMSNDELKEVRDAAEAERQLETAVETATGEPQQPARRSRRRRSAAG